MNLREKIIRASYKAGACHIGSSLSCVEIVEAVYEVKRPQDVFLFAKASGVATLYCYLHPLEKAWRYLKKYPLPNRKVPGVIWSGGSLGQGLSVAVGIALSKKMNKEKGKVYCLISDGELQEGQTQEALMFGSQHKLNNLYVIIDNNGLQSLGKTDEIIRVCDTTLGIDGHSKFLLKKALKTNNRPWPKIIQADTIKGKGVDLMENNNDWHYKNLTVELFEKALKQVSKTEV